MNQYQTVSYLYIYIRNMINSIVTIIMEVQMKQRGNSYDTMLSQKVNLTFLRTHINFNKIKYWKALFK